MVGSLMICFAKLLNKLLKKYSVTMVKIHDPGTVCIFNFLGKNVGYFNEYLLNWKYSWFSFQKCCPLPLASCGYLVCSFPNTTMLTMVHGWRSCASISVSTRDFSKWKLSRDDRFLFIFRELPSISKCIHITTPCNHEQHSPPALGPVDIYQHWSCDGASSKATAAANPQVRHAGTVTRGKMTKLDLSFL